jgi:hypothetical protein
MHTYDWRGLKCFCKTNTRRNTNPLLIRFVRGRSDKVGSKTGGGGWVGQLPLEVKEFALTKHFTHTPKFSKFHLEGRLIFFCPFEFNKFHNFITMGHVCMNIAAANCMAKKR